MEVVAAHLLPAAALKPTWGPARDAGVEPFAAVPYDEALPGGDKAGLSAEEAAAFVERGFLVKRGLVSRTEMGHVSDYVWRHVESTGRLRRDEPQTWFDALEPPGTTRAGHIARYASWWTEHMSERMGSLTAGGWLKMGEKAYLTTLEDSKPTSIHDELQSRAIISPLSSF